MPFFDIREVTVVMYGAFKIFSVSPSKRFKLMLGSFINFGEIFELTDLLDRGSYF